MPFQVTRPTYTNRHSLKYFFSSKSSHSFSSEASSFVVKPSLVGWCKRVETLRNHGKPFMGFLLRRLRSIVAKRGRPSFSPCNTEKPPLAPELQPIRHKRDRKSVV